MKRKFYDFEKKKNYKVTNFTHLKIYRIQKHIFLTCLYLHFQSYKKF
jgi:hypothetical protein